jgi:predicted ATP-binding protein involved in virulence
MRITRLEAQGIGPFGDLNIEFKPKPASMENKAEIHILTGENGTGKSTILMMLASCWDNLNDKLIYERVHKSDVYVEDDGKNYEVDFGRYEIVTNKKSYDFDYHDFQGLPERISQPKKFFIPFGINVNIAFFAYSGYRIAGGSGVVNIEEIRENPLENSCDFLKSMDSQLILKWIANIITKELLSKNKGKKAGGNNAVQKIEKALSGITGKRIEFDLEETLKVSVRVNETSLSFNTLPDGLKSIISWLSDLLMRLDRIDWADKSKSILEQNFILFLDEIEVHLHPSWQRKILPVVQDLFPNAQIFISTHSPFVVGSIDGARVYKFKLDENNNSVLDSEYLTEDGNSYDRILEEIFDIKERFGVGVQKQLEEFKDYKNKILLGEVIDNEAFGELVRNLSNQSIELSNIMGFEIRQIERITKKSLETV